MWVEFVVGSCIVPRFFLRVPVFPPSWATNIYKFQIEQNRGPAWKAAIVDVTFALSFAGFFLLLFNWKLSYPKHGCSLCACSGTLNFDASAQSGILGFQFLILTRTWEVGSSSIEHRAGSGVVGVPPLPAAEPARAQYITSGFLALIVC